MAGADYALCERCSGKVFYDSNTDTQGAAIHHRKCFDREIKEAEERGRLYTMEDVEAAAEAMYEAGTKIRGMGYRSWAVRDDKYKRGWRNDVIAAFDSLGLRMKGRS